MCHSVDREPNVLMGGFNVAIHLMNIVVNKERREYKSETKRYIGSIPIRFMSTVFMIFALYNSVLLFWDINWLGQFVDFYCEHTTEVSKLNVNGKIASGSEVTKISLYDLR